MAIVYINPNKCKGCGLCVAFCPRNTLAVSAESNDAGHHPVQPMCETDCTGCRLCTMMCPEGCIELYEEVEEAPVSE